MIKPSRLRYQLGKTLVLSLIVSLAWSSASPAFACDQQSAVAEQPAPAQLVNTTAIPAQPSFTVAWSDVHHPWPGFLIDDTPNTHFVEPDTLSRQMAAQARAT